VYNDFDSCGEFSVCEPLEKLREQEREQVDLHLKIGGNCEKALL
jgi:hypothetical protein